MKQKSKKCQIERNITKRLLLLTTVIFQHPTLTQKICCKACVEDLKDSYLGSVKVYPKLMKPKNLTGYCSLIFKRDGACCNNTDLYTYAGKWLSKMKATVNKTLEMSSHFKTSLEFISDIKDYIKANEARIKKSKLWRKGELGQFKQQLKDYSLGVIDFSLIHKSMELSKEDCYRTIYTLRSNALCMRCSGAAIAFWRKKENKYAVRKDNCKLLVEQCSTLFSFMAEVSTYFRRLSILVKDPKKKVKKSEHDEITGFGRNDLNQFLKCASNRKSCDELKLCEYFTLHEINPDVEGSVRIFKEGILANLKIIKGRSQGPGKDKKRLLEVDRLVQKLQMAVRVLEESKKRLLADGGGGPKKGSKPGYNRGFVVARNEGADLEDQYNTRAKINSDFKKVNVLNLTLKKLDSELISVFCIGLLIITMAAFLSIV